MVEVVVGEGVVDELEASVIVDFTVSVEVKSCLNSFGDRSAALVCGGGGCIMMCARVISQ